LDGEIPVARCEATLIIAGHVANSPLEGKLLGVSDAYLLAEGDLSAKEAKGHLEVRIILLYGLSIRGKLTDELCSRDLVHEEVCGGRATCR